MKIVTMRVPWTHAFKIQKRFDLNSFSFYLYSEFIQIYSKIHCILISSRTKRQMTLGRHLWCILFAQCRFLNHWFFHSLLDFYQFIRLNVFKKRRILTHLTCEFSKKIILWKSNVYKNNYYCLYPHNSVIRLMDLNFKCICVNRNTIDRLMALWSLTSDVNIREWNFLRNFFCGKK